jgi:type IV secretory pathway component VirB8
MEQEILKRIAEQEEKINRIYISVEKTRKYFLWTMILTIAIVVIPAIILGFVLPSFMTNYVGSLNGSALGL